MASKKRLLLGADHAGYRLKESLRKELGSDWKIEDLSPEYEEGDDYPLVAKKMAKLIAKDDRAQGILVCGTGLGMDIAANRVKGARAVVIRTTSEAKLSREHNHANILVLGGRLTPASKAKQIVKFWLKTPYSRAERHVRRVEELDA